MAAKNKPVTTVSAADLGLDAAASGWPPRAASSRSRTRRRAQAGQAVKDEGDGGAKIADYLVSKKLV